MHLFEICFLFGAEGPGAGPTEHRSFWRAPPEKVAKHATILSTALAWLFDHLFGERDL